MSETNGFQVPAEPQFDTIALQGSMQQILQDNIGNYVSVEFLIGTQTVETRQGLLYSVGTQFIVLYDDINLQYVVCDIFAIKFVIFYLPGYRPGQVPNEAVFPTAAPAQAIPASAAPADPPASPAAPTTAAQAAYAHVLKKTRR